MMMSTDGVTWTMIFTWDDAHKTKRVAYCRPFIIAVGTAFNWGGNTRAITSNDTDKLGERYNGLWEGVGNDEKGANGWLSNGRVFVSCNESTRTTIHTTADGRTWNEITNAPDDTVMATYHLLFTTNCQLSLDDGVSVTMMVSVMSSSMVLISIQTQSSAITISSIDRSSTASCSTRLTEPIKASKI